MKSIAKSLVDVQFNFYSDSNGRDPDSNSPTLRKYHQILWSKPLPIGGDFELDDTKKRAYLYHKSARGEFFLGSDAITHSYKNHKRKNWLTEQIPDQVNELFDTGSTIAGYTIFPNNRIGGGHTINQARGVNSLIDDRFDLTLECIRRYYFNRESPLYSTLVKYTDFFNLFRDFKGYTQFFFLDDLVNESGDINFYLPFDDFKTRPIFYDVKQYLSYKQNVTQFVRLRSKRIEKFVETKLAKNSNPI